MSVRDEKKRKARERRREDERVHGDATDCELKKKRKDKELSYRESN